MSKVTHSFYFIAATLSSGSLQSSFLPSAIASHMAALLQLPCGCFHVTPTLHNSQNSPSSRLNLLHNSPSSRLVFKPLSSRNPVQLRQRTNMQSGSTSEDVVAPLAPSPGLRASEQQKQAAELVQEFYDAVNRRECDSIADLFAEDCVYEDLVFPKPFLGRKAVLEFFRKFMDSVGPELEFKVEDITTGDPNAAGVIWHLEWRGKQFPFSKGCSFYRCEIVDGKRQIKYGRDAVEPATKPGDFTLVAIKGVAALLRRFPWLADKF